ncbi:hypothetical protein IAQ61_008763 [Plenodomus lingam]|uniref:uncharacterized protein n=1 Tax=Leptosphaeria maculans TaxID=5022 RepID=UPI00331FEF1B|nr:hypothetical protein IAQ61_008763 [Plenodomus lingam]
MDSKDNWAFGAVPYAAGVPHSGAQSLYSVPSTAIIVGGTAAVLGGWPLVLCIAGYSITESLAAATSTALRNITLGSPSTVMARNMVDEDIGDIASEIGNSGIAADCMDEDDMKVNARML